MISPGSHIVLGAFRFVCSFKVLRGGRRSTRGSVRSVLIKHVLPFGSDEFVRVPASRV